MQKMIQMENHELEIRKVVWTSISTFYLDTELDQSDYIHIAGELKNTKYTIEQLKEIDLLEIFPILQLNLLGVAGKWDGFDEKWLHRVCRNNFKRRKYIVFKGIVYFMNLIFYRMRKKHWDEVEQLIEKEKHDNRM